MRHRIRFLALKKQKRRKKRSCPLGWTDTLLEKGNFEKYFLFWVFREQTLSLFQFSCINKENKIKVIESIFEISRNYSRSLKWWQLTWKWWSISLTPWFLTTMNSDHSLLLLRLNSTLTFAFYKFLSSLPITYLFEIFYIYLFIFLLHVSDHYCFNFVVPFS